jgi:DNA-binding transcriptional MerR regulator
VKNPITLGRLARATGLARASLLHYESLGLLKPAERNAAGYRLYGESAIERLRLIRQYREVGLSLAAIRDLCGTSADRKRSEPAALLEARLLGLSYEIERLRSQQKLLARLLATREFRNVQHCRDKQTWSNLLRRAGFTDQEMREWHARFEPEAPAEHGAFLQSLGLKRKEIAAICQWAHGDAIEC